MSFEVNGQLTPAGGGDSIPLLRETMVLGRRESCDIPLRFPNVSARHCELTFHDGFWYVRDLNSTNGIKVNGTRVQRKLVHPGDQITIAKRRYTIQYAPPVAGQRALEELEEDILGQSLLERAGLERPKQRGERSSKGFDPADFLLHDDE
jgi:adenylate cyclase